MKIFKYPVDIRVQIPKGAKILKVALQDDEPFLWALVNPNAETEIRKFVIRGTGQVIDLDLKYIDTFFQSTFVWHVFESVR